MVERIIDDLCRFFREKVAPECVFKQPDNENQDGTYNYTEVHPSVFPFFIPPANDFNEGNIPAPCVCVAPVKETVNVGEGTASVAVELRLIVWNPGTHGDELRTPIGPNRYTRPIGHTEGQSFELYGEAFRDVWIFAEKIKRTVLTDFAAAGYALDFQPGIVTEPPKTAMPETFPYFTVTMKFTVTAPTATGQGLQNLL